MLQSIPHQLLELFSISTLIFLAFAILELAFGRFRIRGVPFQESVIDAGTYTLSRSVIRPFASFGKAALAALLFPGAADSLAGTPWWAQVLAFLIFEDMTQYWWHRSVHSFPALWPLHMAHHSAPYMGVRMSSRNSFLYTLLFPNVWFAGIFIYLGFGEVFVWYSAVKTLVTTAAHSELRWDAFLYRYRFLSPLAWIVERTISTPATHFAHHALRENDGIGHFNGNYGNLLFFWDVLYGTARITRKYPPAFGIEVDPQRGPEPWMVQIFYPLFRPRSATGNQACQPVADPVPAK